MIRSEVEETIVTKKPAGLRLAPDVIQRVDALIATLYRTLPAAPSRNAVMESWIIKCLEEAEATAGTPAAFAKIMDITREVAGVTPQPITLDHGSFLNTYYTETAGIQLGFLYLSKHLPLNTTTNFVTVFNDKLNENYAICEGVMRYINSGEDLIARRAIRLVYILTDIESMSLIQEMIQGHFRLADEVKVIQL